MAAGAPGVHVLQLFVMYQEVKHVPVQIQYQPAVDQIVADQILNHV